MASDSLFGLHGNWEVLPLGEACRRGGGNVQTGPFGSQLHASDYVSTGIPSVMPQNIGDNRISEDGISRITQEDADRLSKYSLRTGDIVYSRRGDVERRALVRRTEDGWLCGTGCLRIRFGEGVVYPTYAAHYLGHPAVREWIVRHAHGATMPNLNTTILSDLPFVLPPWNAQVSIGDAIEAYDGKIDLNRRINQTLEAMAQAIFQSWFVDFDPVKAKIAAKAEGRDPLRAAMSAISGRADAELDGLPPEQYEQLATIAALFPEEMETVAVVEVPKGWALAALSTVCDLNANSWSAKTLPASVKYVDLANTKNGEVIEVQTLEGPHIPSRARRILEVGDTIVGTVRPGNRSFALVGEAGLTGSTGFAVLSPKESYLREYVYLAATVDANIERLAHLADGGAYPAVRPELVVSDALPIPPADLLREFHRISSCMLDHVMEVRRANKSLADLRDALLPKLLSGELSVEALAETAGAA